MARLELPGSPITVAHGPDRTAAVGMGPPHNGLLIVGRVGGVSNVDPSGRRHCRNIFFFCLFCFWSQTEVCQEATTKTWARSSDSANRLEEKTEELGSELHLPSIFWEGIITSPRRGGSRAVWRQRVGTSSWATESFSARSSRRPSRARWAGGNQTRAGSRRWRLPREMLCYGPAMVCVFS